MDDLARRTQAMVRYIEAQKAAHPGVDTYGFGYSNGANILASVMMARPELFDRVGLLHPLIPWEPEPVAGLAGRHVLVTAGRQDPICPWPVSARFIEWLAAQGAEVETVIHEGGHERRPEELQALARLLT
ncbi:alpha/beta hydrolase [Roseovarius sp. B08]|uniref:alpha/beta hydrolase n=1 Tax=Roseovarius sp. B08 TaxID=3449223 RepID=UPI003EDBC4DD